MKKVTELQEEAFALLKKHIESGVLVATPRYPVGKHEIVIGELTRQEKILFTLDALINDVEYDKSEDLKTFKARQFIAKGLKRILKKKFKVEDEFVLSIREGYKVVKIDLKMVDNIVDNAHINL